MPHGSQSDATTCVTAQEAAQLLNVRPQTLYAYVSHGWIRSIRQSGRKNRLYLREDIDRMAARSQARSGHGAAAAAAMHGGAPIIPTFITEITPGGPAYRGHHAVHLAQAGMSFEATAELLWSGRLPERSVRWATKSMPAQVRKLTDMMCRSPHPAECLDTFALLALLLNMNAQSRSDHKAQEDSLGAARQLIAAFAGGLGYLSPARRFVPIRRDETIAGTVLRALNVTGSTAHREVLDAILVLLADHELSPGTFTARIAASGRATLHRCITSAINSNAITRTWHSYDHVEALLSVPSSLSKLLSRACDAQRRGSVVPGFGHPLYLCGDPRATFMLETLATRLPASRRLDTMLAFVERMRIEFELRPRQEFSTVVLANALGLPKGSSPGLFVIARTAGLVAHVLEQRLSPNMLRPRAKFVGMRASPT